MDNMSDDEILLGFNSIIHSLKSLSNHCDVKLSLNEATEHTFIINN